MPPTLGGVEADVCRGALAVERIELRDDRPFARVRARDPRHDLVAGMSARVLYLSCAGYVLPLQTKCASSHCLVMHLSWPKSWSCGSPSGPRHLLSTRCDVSP
jgi:hypothetical protein